jgi:hypothetical protein
VNNEILQDEIAVSVAEVLASANRKAKELVIDAQTSLITARAVFGERRLAVARLLRRERLRRAVRRFDD